MNQTQIEKLSERLRLSPYQSYILAQNGHKYDIDRLYKRGDVLYAPYRCGLCKDTRDYLRKLIFGPRVDLVGSERMLIVGQRGVRLYATGFYKALDNAGQYYYADSYGTRINRSLFENILGL